MKSLNLLIKSRPAPRWTRFVVAALFAAAVAGCGGGSDGAPGAAGAPGTPADPTVVSDLTAKVKALTQATNPETCVTCHSSTSTVALSGSGHQDRYDALYQFNKADSAALPTNTGITVYDMAIAVGTTTVANDTTTLTFKMAQNGNAFDCSKVAADYTISAYYDSYADGKFTFPGTVANGYYFGLKDAAKVSYASGVCTFTKTFSATDDLAVVAKLASGHGVVLVSGADKIQNPPVTGGKFLLAKYPFAGALNLGGAAEAYVSSASSAACESCHTAPFLKHGYIPGSVNVNYPGTATTGSADFYTCKSCHSDARPGGHQLWQLLREAKDANETATAAETAKTADAVTLRASAKTLGDRVAAINGGSALTAAEKTKYGYKTRLMNDVHMSHAMEFPYPQGMNSCKTCHDTPAKRDIIFSNANFTAETCVSCHSVEGIKAKMKAVSKVHDTYLANFDDSTLRAGMNDCSTCHDVTKLTPIGPSSRTIHSGGYDPKIYTSTGEKYSTAMTADVGAVSFDSATNKLNIKLTAKGTQGSLAASNITPTFLVGLYGYDSKDFLVAAHGTNADKQRNLEYVWGGTATNNATNRFKEVGKTTAAGVTTWEVTADLSAWKDKIASGAIKRAEIAALPTLKDAAGTILALNAPSKTFNLVTKADLTVAEAKALGLAVIVPLGATTCNTCHDALATTFHSADRGGNVVVCRICHEVSNPGAHLEMQSRSIDSYVHAIHSFQAFDIKNIDMTDKFSAMEYKSHTGTQYPKFGITDCKSCHAAGTYEVPNQGKSMPGVLSASSAFKAGARNISGIPQYVTGPAVRACGSCHRSEMINKDDATGLAVLNAHFKQNGYMVENETGLWDSIVAKLMAIF